MTTLTTTTTFEQPAFTFDMIENEPHVWKFGVSKHYVGVGVDGNLLAVYEIVMYRGVATPLLERGEHHSDVAIALRDHFTSEAQVWAA